MRYDQLDVELPDTGLVLITGQNGAGKSAVLEAVSYAGWGKTLRGTDPRREGEAGAAVIRLDDARAVQRNWVGKPPKVSVDLSDGVTYDTATKAQEAINATLGEWEVWRRSCAFSSADDLSFASASDADRKRLLESMLGLSRFDAALERCRVDARQAAGHRAAADTALIRAQATLDAVTGSLSALEAAAAASAPREDLASLEARLVTLEAMLPDREESARVEEVVVAARLHGRSQWSAQMQRAQADLRRTTQSAACPTCGQSWPDQTARDAAREAAAREVEYLLEAEAKPPDQLKVQHARAAVIDCRNGIAQLAGKLFAAREVARGHAEAGKLVQNAKLKLLDLEDAVDARTTELAAATTRVASLDLVDTTLGTRGARAHMLAESLLGLEQAANGWLDRVAREDAPLRLKLSPYTERKSGGTSDAISLEVTGAGGGRGYKAASGGEKRRIDVALTLALAEVAQAASGMAAPTTWLDEVFDALDDAGVEAVTLAVRELARDRCVVVISHSPHLIERLRPDLRLHVVDGVMVVR